MVNFEFLLLLFSVFVKVLMFVMVVVLIVFVLFFVARAFRERRLKCTKGCIKSMCVFLIIVICFEMWCFKFKNELLYKFFLYVKIFFGCFER